MSKQKTALITGINGMDGSHLADLLISKDYEVHGLIRRHAVNDSVLKNLKHIPAENLNIHVGDLTDASSIAEVVQDVQPDEVYNLAAQSFVGSSWQLPTQTAEVNAIGVVNVLEACRRHQPDARIYQASTSEMFGKQQAEFANEDTKFYPRSPYGVAKLYAHWMCINYRESYDMFTCCGMLFNHESERRGIEFVTQKIARGVAEIHCGLTDHITLGNLDARRDWGYAPDYVEAMWQMLQLDEPDDFVIGTGTDHSVKDFLTAAFDAVLIQPGEHMVRQDPRFMRPAEVDYLRADASKAFDTFGWRPKVLFEELVLRMVQSQVDAIRKEIR
jgi:GDPmannose 4,6-dehydratase